MLPYVQYSDCRAARAASRRQPTTARMAHRTISSGRHAQRRGQGGQGLKSEVVHHQYYDDISIIYFEYDLLQQLGQGGAAPSGGAAFNV